MEAAAADIAQKLAGRLGWKLWDQLMTNQIARLMECESRQWSSTRSEGIPALPFIQGLHARQLRRQSERPAHKDGGRRLHSRGSERVVRAAAKEGNSIIVGRGSAYYLRDRPDAFHVFIYALSKRR